MQIQDMVLQCTQILLQFINKSFRKFFSEIQRLRIVLYLRLYRIDQRQFFFFIRTFPLLIEGDIRIQRNMLFSFYKCYANLITILTKSSSRIILMEPFLFPCPACYRTWLPFRQEIAQMICQLSEQFQFPYLTLHEELNEKARRYGYSEITTDGIHLTERGQRFLADRLYELICGYSPY